MKFWYRKTESEKVESIRKVVKMSKWIGLFYLCGFIFFSVSFFVVWNMTSSLKDMFPEMTESITQEAHIGIIIGGIAGLQLILAIMCIGWAFDIFFGHSTSKMMLKYYDKLKEIEDNSQQINGLY